jgi:hypothetical protein
VAPLRDRVELLEGDCEVLPGIRCVLYANSHTPGHQCIYVDTNSGCAAIVGDIARKVDVNMEQAIPPAIYYILRRCAELSQIFATERITFCRRTTGTRSNEVDFKQVCWSTSSLFH